MQLKPITAGRRIRAFALVLALALAVASPHAAGDALEGAWEGAIEIPGGELAIAVDFSRLDGDYRGEIDIPAQGARDLALSEISLDGERVRFRIRGIPGDPTFDGILAGDGDSMAGSFTQGGQQLTFRLSRRHTEAESAADPLEGIAELIESRRADWGVPGLAVAIVRGGEVVHAAGYGLRETAGEATVTPRTLFAIGSATKAFTATLLGVLVDEGGLDWDEPVRRHLPEYALADEMAGARITARDLLTHRSGLPRHDLAWYGAGATREELVRRIAHLEPSRDFRDRFQYQNLMYLTAGYLAGRIDGTSWEDSLRRRVLDPLGMRATTLDAEGSARARDRAAGHARKRGGAEGEAAIEVVPRRDLDAMAPAGSIESSAEEMARWLLFQLGRGAVEQRRIVSESMLTTLHTPQVVVPPESPIHRLSVQPEMPHLMYAMGWFVQGYRGHELLHHGGNIDGFTAAVGFVPGVGGAVVLANLGGTLLPRALLLEIHDRLLGLEPIDWSARMRQLQTTLEAAAEQQKQAAGERVEGTSPGHAAPDYAAAYRHPGYGDLVVEATEGTGLRLRYNAIDGPAEHWHYDVFRVAEGIAEGTTLTFTTNARGDVDGVLLPLEVAVEPVRFDRLPPLRLLDPGFLGRLVGDYDLNGARCEVRLRGTTTLTVSVPGQPTYRLEPYRETEFDLRGLSGYSVRFLLEEDRVRSLAFVQPNGTFEAEREDR